MFTGILFLLAQASLPAAPVDVRKEDSALLPTSGAVLYNNVYGKGDIVNYRQLVSRGQDDAGWSPPSAAGSGARVSTSGSPAPTDRARRTS